jgi:dihydrofolate reductase
MIFGCKATSRIRIFRRRWPYEPEAGQREQGTGDGRKGQAAVQRVSLIVAMTRGGVIGRGGSLPWKLSADLKRFKSLTMGHHLVMGRKTYDSLGRVLPGRTTIVLTRQTGLSLPSGVLIAHTLGEAIGRAAGDAEVFVIGGGEIFDQAQPKAERIYVTWVEADVEGDTQLPDWDPSAWRLIDSQPHPADAKNEYDTTFCIYDRI